MTSDFVAALASALVTGILLILIIFAVVIIALFAISVAHDYFGFNYPLQVTFSNYTGGITSGNNL